MPSAAAPEADRVIRRRSSGGRARAHERLEQRAARLQLLVEVGGRRCEAWTPTARHVRAADPAASHDRSVTGHATASTMRVRAGLHDPVQRDSCRRASTALGGGEPRSVRVAERARVPRLARAAASSVGHAPAAARVPSAGKLCTKTEHERAGRYSSAEAGAAQRPPPRLVLSWGRADGRRVRAGTRRDGYARAPEQVGVPRTRRRRTARAAPRAASAASSCGQPRPPTRRNGAAGATGSRARAPRDQG